MENETFGLYKYWQLIKQLFCKHKLYKNLKIPVMESWNYCNGVAICKKCDKDFDLEVDLI